MTNVSCDEGVRRFDADMMTTIVSIKAIRNGMAIVEASPQQACGGCVASSGCGGKAFSSAMTKPLPPLAIHNDFGGYVGDEIEIGIPQSSLLKGAMLVYLFPLAGMLMGALLGAEIFANNGIELIFGVAGLVFGIWYARVFTRSERFTRSLQPVFIRKSPRHAL